MRMSSVMSCLFIVEVIEVNFKFLPKSKHHDVKCFLKKILAKYSLLSRPKNVQRKLNVLLPTRNLDYGTE